MYLILDPRESWCAGIPYFIYHKTCSSSLRYKINPVSMVLINKHVLELKNGCSLIQIDTASQAMFLSQVCVNILYYIHIISVCITRDLYTVMNYDTGSRYKRREWNHLT